MIWVQQQFITFSLVVSKLIKIECKIYHSTPGKAKKRTKTFKIIVELDSKTQSPWSPVLQTLSGWTPKFTH